MPALFVRRHPYRPLWLTLIALGMLLFLAARPASSDGAYVVQAGDTLSGIAAHFGVNLDDLAQANGLVNRNLIMVGQTLRIPDGGTAAPAPAPAAAPPTTSAPPTRLVIPAIGLNTPVTASSSYMAWIGGQLVRQQYVPPYSAGWHNDTSLPGQGNTVLSGHHNIYGRVFGSLVNLGVGAPITLWSGNVERHYVVTQRLILPEEGMPLATRLANARWMEPTSDSRLTLVTCWPAWTNTHRLVVVAMEVE